MEELCSDFARSTQLQIHNPTSFQLYLNVGGGVFSSQQLFAHTCIGEIEGVPMYIWDVDHNDYMIVDDEFVVDVSQTCPRSILTWVRDENQSDAVANCVIRMDVNETTRETRFFLWTTARLDEGDELVYSPIY